MNDIGEWLEQHRLGEYAQLFAAQRIDADVLAELTEADLKDFGVPFGDRKRLLRAIAAIDASVSSESAPMNTELDGTHTELPDASSSQAERRQLTVMFCDLVGSTALSRELDPEELREINRRYQDTAKAAIEQYDGYIARYMGDGVLAYFGYPRAHEDDAERAVRAGLLLTEQVPDASPGRALSVRVGIATGPVVVGDIIGEGASQESAVVGETPNLAARLQGVAGENQVMLAESTKRLIEGRFELKAIEPQHLRGIDEPVPVYRAVQVISAGRYEATHGQGPGRMSGRESELALLTQRWQQAKQADGQVVLLEGEPGIGKSRLVQELRSHAELDDAIVLRYQCSPYHSATAFYPVVEQMQGVAGFRRDDAPHIHRQRLETLVADLLPNRRGLVPLLASLLSVMPPPEDMTPQQRKAETVRILADLIECLAARGPVLMIFEDAHWIDPSTKGWLDAVFEKIQSLAVLCIVTHRPEFSPPWKGFGHTTSLSLNRLGKAEARSIVERLAQGVELADEVVEEILARTDGIPLFTEELTKAVVEGAHTDGGVKGAMTSSSVPATLQDSLMARLDRLEDAKELAQIGACIGREFHHDLLAGIYKGTSKSLEKCLELLLDSELVFRRTDADGVTYVFKHALVEDVAYQSLLHSRRRELHGAIAHALEARFAEMVSSQPERLARHQSEAQMFDRAAENWLRAGEMAATRAANWEAGEHLSKGLSLVRGLTDSREARQLELKLLAALGPVLMATKGYGALDVGEIYGRFRTIANSDVGSPNQRFAATFGLWLHHQGRAEFPRARELIDELFDFVADYPAADYRIQALHAAWTTELNTGEFERSHDFAEECITLYRRETHHRHYLTYGGHDPGACAYIHSAQALWFLGYPERGWERAEQSVALARELSHPPSLIASRFFALMLAQFLRDAERVRVESEAMIVLTKQRGPVTWFAASRVMHAWAVAKAGDLAEGLNLSRVGVADYQKTGNVVREPYYRALHAELCLLANEVEEGLKHTHAALQVISVGGDAHWEAELHRLSGELLLAGAETERAMSHFHKALEVSRAQKARMLELRAAHSFARSMPENRELVGALRELYGSFSEGFNRPDLEEVNAYLNGRS